MTTTKQHNIIVLTVAAAALGVIGYLWAVPNTPNVTEVANTPSLDIAAGKTLYAKNCAACHGANLEGQPNWQVANDQGIYPAPPHDESGHTWHHSDQLLFDYVKIGGAGVLQAKGVSDFKSGMPAFGDTLNDTEIRNILGFIASTWPKRIQDIRKKRAANK